MQALEAQPHAEAMAGMQIWWRLTSFGDSGLLLSCAILAALWLLMAPSSRRLGGWWLGAVVLDASVVALSKLLFLGWNVYPKWLNFTGLSGDCAMAFLCWPVVGAFITARAPSRRRALFIGAGAVLGVIVAVSRVLLHAHTLTEALLGSAWGASLAAAFLWVTRRHPLTLPAGSPWMPLAALVLLLFVYGRGFSFEPVLGWAAKRISGHTYIYRRADYGVRDYRHPGVYLRFPRRLLKAAGVLAERAPARHHAACHAFRAETPGRNLRGHLGPGGLEPCDFRYSADGADAV